LSEVYTPRKYLTIPSFFKCKEISQIETLLTTEADISEDG
jgi:hypothetical protein